MHIAMVHRDLHQLTRGGICTLYRSLAEHMAARGHHVTLLTQESATPLITDTANVVTLPRTEHLDGHRKNVADTLLRIKPDVVDCSTWEAETLVYLDFLERAPVLVRGEFSAATLGAADLAEDERTLVHRADDLIAVSHYAANDLAAAYNITVPDAVHNGIDRSRFHPAAARQAASGWRVWLSGDGRPTNPEPLANLLGNGDHVPPFTPDPRGRVSLIWVGKITPMKGWDRLEEIAARIQDIATITVLLGHSPAFSPVTVDPDLLTVLHDLDDEDVPELYRHADWLLSTSRWEGFGLAIAEAIACGTPALLPHDLGTAPELLAAGGGFTYQDIDDLTRILTTQQRPAADLPRHFDWGVNAAATIDRYTRLLAG